MTARSAWRYLSWAIGLGVGLLVSWPVQLVAQTSVALPKELQTVTLPNDVHIVPPQPDVPSDFAAFSGMWAGVWSYPLPTVLVVESITMAGSVPEATVVYAWGAGGQRAPGYFRVRAYFINGELHVVTPAGARATYRMRSDGRLDGAHFFQGHSAKAILKRIEQP